MKTNCHYLQTLFGFYLQYQSTFENQKYLEYLKHSLKALEYLVNCGNLPTTLLSRIGKSLPT